MQLTPGKRLLFGTAIGAEIGMLLGLTYGSMAVCIELDMAHGKSHPHHVGWWCVRLLIVPTLFGLIAGALSGLFAAEKLFPRRLSVLAKGFIICGVLSCLLGFGVMPLVGPLGASGNGPIAVCLMAMMALHMFWPDKLWARIVSSLAIAAWILGGFVLMAMSV